MEIQLIEKRLMEEQKEAWIPLMDYAIKNGISLSTLRRHIKANKLTYKVESGRYLIWDNGSTTPKESPPRAVTRVKSHDFESMPQQDSDSSSNQLINAVLQEEIHKLTQELQKAKKEIVELKTLIAFYEENNSVSGPHGTSKS
jgi:hypothetical protein